MARKNPSTPPSTPPPDPLAEVTESIRRLTAIWRALLGLQDWEVFVRVVDDLGQAEARIEISSEHREAEMAVLDPRKMAPGSTPLGRHIELTVVHELLHLYFYQANEDADEERAINRLTRAVVGLAGPALQ